MLENIQLAIQGIWGHKMRSFLTMLGIIIGIASIITIVSTIKGTNEQIKQNLIGAGNNVVTVQVFQDDYAYDFSYAAVPDGIVPITQDTVQTLRTLEGVQEISLYYTRSYSEDIYYLDTAFSGGLYGVDEQYLKTNGYQLCYGRTFLPEDYANYRSVAVLDTKAVTALFGGQNPVGQTIEIRRQPFTIVGVVDQRVTVEPNIQSMMDYQLYADTSSGAVFIPSAAWPIVYRFDEPQAVCVQAASTDEMTTAGKNVADYLTGSQIQSVSGNFTYQSTDLQEQIKQLQSMSNSTNRQLIWIASISLLVGGIGVMNIMLVSVTERTSEIGLKKAIGAKRRRILWQFLTEAAVLTGLGGLLGVAGGAVLAKLISHIMGTPTAISVPAIAVAVLFSTLIGVVFGLLPAMKAAKLNPIEALRRE